MHAQRTLIAAPLIALVAACAADSGARDGGAAAAADAAPPSCDADNGGLTLAAGFCALVAHDGVGPARHIAVAPNGDVYVAMRGGQNAAGGVTALRDTNGDGRLDETASFGDAGGTGMAIHDGHLYFAPNTSVLRYVLDGRSLAPIAEPDTLISGFPEQRSHAAKSLAVDPAGSLFVNVGGPSNACQEQDRQAGSPGRDPCPELDRQTGIWRFDLGRTGQRQTDGERYATGIRNAVAIDFDHAGNTLWAVQHGRDMLNVIAPEQFTAEDNAELPAEELLRVERGADFGHPYCYFDPRAGRRVLAPEYGGDGSEIGRCAGFALPVATYPGHWAPNDVLIYAGDQFPARFRGGAFIAFHGSWNRAPLPQRGYKVVFQPPANGATPAEFVVFADGFAGVDPIPGPGDAAHRPVGLAHAPDGSLYIVDSVRGRIWRVVWQGGQ